MNSLRLVLYFVIVGAVLALTTLAIRDLIPPKTVRFAAGIQDGGYWRYAERYRDILARDGIVLDLVATAGSVENADLLDRRAVDVGFLQGAFALSPPLPPTETRLLSLVARLVAAPDLHPALVDRLVEAAVEVHGQGDLLSAEGTYPSVENTSLPVHHYVRDRLMNGPSNLAPYLPYWATAQIERLAILLLPIIFLLLPLLRTLPGLYRWGIRSRVFRHYARILEIDDALDGLADAARFRELDRELRGLDRKIAALKLPLAYADYAYNARLHIELLRRKIEREGPTDSGRHGNGGSAPLPGP
ncbi:hypothetical protein JANAI62_20510 [Jannaschia pagri]|uniref:C4-dicarboxylate ABC transporter substrate-binding protein n=1 Tax=Jannaschia pagri TaxID=2829797 RepID=A0ABQ4NLY8_9RHOB|nr:MULTISPECIES: hypothetical protein [unclassified Jannaschia]GIT91594.1 hypothetical protein JANAI61_20520 [Jannaschia sp. AI_61]GIT95428.1 hypothetical protein JANAI62_20510 [Jannaschia sp. AI_62]